MDRSAHGMIRMTWGPWLRGESVKRALAKMLGQIAPKPFCPRCGTETTEDNVLRTFNCHVCQKTWTKMELLIEIIDRRRITALVEICNGAGTDSGTLCLPATIPAQPIVVDG